MSFSKEEVLNRIKRAYSSSHDIKAHENNSCGLVMEAEFHMHSEKYLLSKRAQLYQMDSNEYVFIYYYPNLTLELFNKCMEDSYSAAFPNIKPDSNHRSSYIVSEFLYDTCDLDVIKAAKKYRRRKSFQFSLQGWMEVHTVLIDLGTESVISNSDGRFCGKFLKNVLHPKKRRGIRLF